MEREKLIKCRKYLLLRKTDLEVKVYWIPPHDDRQDLILHIDIDDATP